MSDRGARRAGTFLVIITALAAIAAVADAVPGAAKDEGELLRLIKSDVFDRQWSQVLAECDEFIRNYPRSQALPRAYYYRAQALDSLKRLNEALEGYSEFLNRFPAEAGAIREDALLKRITLSRTLYQTGATGHLWVILEGMDEKGNAQVYAAIESTKIDHAPAHKKAIPILKDCAQFETEQELRNECVVALLRVAPGEVPSGTTTPPKRDGDQARLIKVEVFNKLQSKIVVKVNLPLAFAELLLESLDDQYRQMIEQHLLKDVPEAPKSLPDLKKLFEEIRKGGPQTIIEIDGEEERIRVWIE